MPSTLTTAISQLLYFALCCQMYSTRNMSQIFEANPQSPECDAQPFINITDQIELKSPYFPLPYKPNTYCQWFIQVEFGFRIRVEFVIFQLEGWKPRDCEIYDYLRISDILYNRSFCGKLGPVNNTYLSRGPVITLVFTSNHQIEDIGFKLIISKVKVPCGNVYQKTTTGNLFSNPKVRTTTRNSLCSWLFEAKEGEAISISCDRFHLQNSYHCKREALLINKYGDNVVHHFTAFCNSFQIFNEISTGNKIQVIFFSNIQYPSTEFHCKYEIASNADEKGVLGCGTNLELFTHPSLFIRIVGGQKAAPNLPVVGIWRPEKPSLFCGGALIASQFVLTAAHCVRTYLDNYPMIYVKKGAEDPIFWTIRNMVIHENPQDKLSHDIALIHVLTDTGARKGDWACLPEENCDLTKKFVTVFGWGETGNFEVDQEDRFSQVTVPVTDLHACEKFYKTRTGFPISDYNFCAGISGKDSCRGDSGGPAVLVDNNQLTVVGLVSFGLTACGNYPGVYVKLSAYRNWILEQVKNLSSA